MKMNRLSDFGVARITLLMAVVAAIALAAGCAQTVQQQPTAPATPPGATAPAGFLGKDYSMLRPGNPGEAALIYISPNIQWSQYDKIMLEPVEFWDTDDSTVTPANQHMLTAYFYNQLKADLEQHFTIVDQAGPGVMTMQVALTSAEGAKPGMRSVSVYAPMGLVINSAKYLTTGSYAFVGSAQAEGRLTDSETGQLLAAFADKREGGMNTDTSAQRTWGDAKFIMDYWAQRMSNRLYQAHTSGTIPTAK